MDEYNSIGATYYLDEGRSLLVGDGVTTQYSLSRIGLTPCNIIGTFDRNNSDVPHKPWVSFVWELLDNGYLRISPELPVGYKVEITFTTESEAT